MRRYILTLIMGIHLFSSSALAMGDLYLYPHRDDTEVGYTLVSECIHCWFNEKVHIKGTITFYDKRGNIFDTQNIDNYHDYKAGSSDTYTRFWDATDYDNYRNIKRATIEIVASAPNTGNFNLTYSWKFRW